MRETFGPGQSGSVATVRVLAALARALQLAHGAPECFYFAFVSPGLAFETFEHFENLLHFFQGFPEVVDDFVDLIDGLLDRWRRARAGSPRWPNRLVGNPGFHRLSRERL